MFSPKKAAPVNASAIAVNAWIQEIEEAHQQIQRELEDIRYGGGGKTQARVLEEIIESLRRLRSVVPTPRMITAWVSSDPSPFLN